MDPTPSLRPALRDWLLSSPLAPCLEAFVAHLRLGRYAHRTSERYLGCIAHLGRWMSQCHLPLERLDEAMIERFLGDHLRRCDGPSPVVHVRNDLRAACGHLLRVLREQGAVATIRTATGPIANELRGFDEHLREVRGLAPETRSNCLRIVQLLLQRRFAEGPVVIAELQPSDVREFLAEQLDHRHTVSHAHALATALRAYFRYRTTCGDAVHGLVGVVSAPARWRLTSLPRSLSSAEVDRLLQSFTADLPSPRRGYAIVRCALDMGLRVGEVAGLTLSDIDWRAGTVTVRRTKSRREDVLPLPETTGRALADYLRHERPTTTNPAVLVRRFAPHDQPISADAIHRVIRDAYQRIGLTHGRTHALRHTLVRRLLEHGSSLKEVADVLRHRSLDTALVYAKLDSPRLAAVALPWPGSSA